MMYISKGMVLDPTSTEYILKVARCGQQFTLTSVSATLWLNGRLGVAESQDILQETKLQTLVRMGLAEKSVETGPLANFRLLSSCVICPAKLKVLRRPLNQEERWAWRWLNGAGLRLTLSEIIFLAEENVAPVPALLGTSNRQALTERIYSSKTISNGLLEAEMEHSRVRDQVVTSVLGLLAKKRILLV